MAVKKKWVARIYVGGGKYQWVGRFATRRERDKAKAAALLEVDRARYQPSMTCGAYVDRFLAEYELSHKDSSIDTARGALKGSEGNPSSFLRAFGERPLNGISRIEAKEWAAEVPPSRVPVVVTMFNQAVEDELLDRNPFRGLTRRSRGRADERPPTHEELDALLAACSVHAWYAPRMRALVVFAAYSGMRPGEIFELEWTDIDFQAMRITVRRRVYKGRVDTPKSGKVKTIALTPPARDALLGLPRDDRLVFTTKRGKRFSQPTLSGYWGKVTARGDVDIDFYLATKHYCVHYLFTELNLQPRVIAEQMGWTLGSVLKLLAVYGHGDIGALDEIDAAFRANVTPLRPVQDAAGDANGA